MKNGALSRPSSFVLTLLCLTGVLIRQMKQNLEDHLELCHKSIQQQLPTKNTARKVCTHASLDN